MTTLAASVESDLEKLRHVVNLCAGGFTTLAATHVVSQYKSAAEVSQFMYKLRDYICAEVHSDLLGLVKALLE